MEDKDVEQVYVDAPVETTSQDGMNMKYVSNTVVFIYN